MKVLVKFSALFDISSVSLLVEYCSVFGHLVAAISSHEVDVRGVALGTVRWESDQALFWLHRVGTTLHLQTRSLASLKKACPFRRSFYCNLFKD